MFSIQELNLVSETHLGAALPSVISPHLSPSHLVLALIIISMALPWLPLSRLMHGYLFIHSPERLCSDSGGNMMSGMCGMASKSQAERMGK